MKYIGLGWRRPDRGRVTVAGVDLADMDRGSWLEQVAWVPQRPILVRGTVADNLRLAASHAGPDRGCRGRQPPGPRSKPRTAPEEQRAHRPTGRHQLRREEDVVVRLVGQDGQPRAIRLLTRQLES